MLIIVCCCFLFCWKQKRHTLKNDADATNFQPVNSDLNPFYAFSVLGPAGPGDLTSEIVTTIGARGNEHNK